MLRRSAERRPECGREAAASQVHPPERGEHQRGKGACPDKPVLPLRKVFLFKRLSPVVRRSAAQDSLGENARLRYHGWHPPGGGDGGPAARAGEGECPEKPVPALLSLLCPGASSPTVRAR